MTATVGDLAGAGTSAGTALWANTICADLTLEASPGGSQGITGDLLVDVDGLGMLAQVIETGESPGAVALKGTFAGVLTDMTG